MHAITVTPPCPGSFWCYHSPSTTTNVDRERLVVVGREIHPVSFCMVTPLVVFSLGPQCSPDLRWQAFIYEREQFNRRVQSSRRVKEQQALSSDLIAICTRARCLLPLAPTVLSLWYLENGYRKIHEILDNSA
eukprot:6176110-Pleurochrysis_carterae.AAC.3